MLTVTISITCKNSRSTIKQCIDSLLIQNYPKNAFKVFVVDALSTDGTYEILKSYGRKIRLEQVKGNIAVGHNYIIQNSFTDLIALTDADCVVDKNWLKELIKPFEDEKIGATAGLCKTPENVNKLQEIIGRELDSRFENFPKFISRAPTMNLAFRTELAKECLFDESFNVAQETDWGYRFTNPHKMQYVPSATVYHYHRASWKNYFKQQFRYGTMMPKLYLKHRNRTKGDEISTTSMMLQVVLLYVISLFFIFQIFLPAVLLLLLLGFIYVNQAFHLAHNQLDSFIHLLGIFIVRNIAWNLGILVGILR